MDQQRPRAARTHRGASRMRPNYGVDAPTVVRNLAVVGAFLLVLGLVAVLASGARPPVSLEFMAGWLVSVGIALLGTSGLMAFGSKVLKPRRLPGLLLRPISLEGHERVLDVGCGRGLILTTVARHLTTGRAIGVDIWRGQDQSGNTPRATLENARAEGVAGRVEVITGDARRLPFGDGSFDAVVASLAIHNISKEDERRRVVLEIVRVLRPGGRVAILDFQKTGEFAEGLREGGLSDVEVSPPRVATVPTVRVVTARKP